MTVRLWTHEVMGLTERDVALAQQISAAARDLGVPADPSAVQTVQVAIDALVSNDVMPFWRAVLGYEQVGDEDLVDPRRRGPAIWFQQMEEPRTERNRIHIDVSVPHDQAEARVAAGVAAGGRIWSTARPGVVDPGRRRGQRGRHRQLDGPRVTQAVPCSVGPSWHHRQGPRIQQ